MSIEIIVGDDSYTTQIVSGNILAAQPLDGNELQYDTLDATLDLGGMVPTIYRPSGSGGFLTADGLLLGVLPNRYTMLRDPDAYQYGTVVRVLHSDAQLGKFYLSSMSRVSRTYCQLLCVSAVGLLANTQHYGGIYSGQTMAAVVADIIGGVVPYTLAETLQAVPVYGWLPVATRRDNLHQLLFAMGCAVLQDDEGDMLLAPLSARENYREIPDNRLFLGGEIKFADAVTQVSVSEHTYLALDTDSRTTLYDGQIIGSDITTPLGHVVSGDIVLFDGPMHDLLVSNGTVLESGVNYAVLGPSASCQLTGQQYTHTVRQVTRPETSAARSLVSAADNKITVTDATLISVVNSEAVADRLMSYYGSAKTIDLDIVVDGERTGDPVRFTDPWGELTEGTVQSMDISLSRTLRAKTSVVSGYDPGGSGNFYNNVDVVTSDAIWAVPDGVTKIRVVLIGGGPGGSSGNRGENGDGYSSGAGGDGGQGGTGGRILIKTMTVTPGTGHEIHIGQGGEGGVCTASGGADGEEGEATTFWMPGTPLSSADGLPSSIGYTDLFNGETYGLPGHWGYGGGGGAANGYPGTEVVGGDSVTYVPGGRGDSDKASGTNPNGKSWSGTAYGGYGGGPAYNANGGDGGDGEVEHNNGWGWVNTGSGGKGADATIPGADATIPGSGGHGGHGGGGGGGDGGGTHSGTNGISPPYGGRGGLGSPGGRGAPGICLIYY